MWTNWTRFLTPFLLGVALLLANLPRAGACPPQSKEAIVSEEPLEEEECDADAPETPKPDRTGRFVLDSPVRAVAVSPDGKYLAAGGLGNGSVRVWDVGSGKELQQFASHGGGVTALAFSPDGKTLAVGGWDAELALYDPVAGKLLREFPRHKAGITSIAFSPDGKHLASVTLTSAQVGFWGHIWDTATGTEVHPLPGPFQRPPREEPVSIAYSPDGKRLAAMIRNDPSLLWWDAATGKEKMRGPRLHIQEPLSFAFSPDGKWIAIDSEDGPIVLCQAGTGKERRRLGTRNPGPRSLTTVRRIAFSPDGRTLAATNSGTTVTLWELATGQPRAQRRYLDGGASCLAFAPDGRFIVSGSDDTTARIWNLAGDGPLPAKEPTARELDVLWAELRSDEGLVGGHAIASLLAAPGSAVRLLKERVPVQQKAEGERINRLIADLSSNHFSVRLKATEDLEFLGERAEPALLDALKARPSLDMSRRIEQLLLRIDSQNLSPEQIRQIRAVEILETLASPEARKLLRAYAAGADDARVTLEARAALDRLARRAPS